MFKSIRSQITVPYILLILLVFGGLGIYLSNFVRQTYLTNLQTSLTTQAHLVADEVVVIVKSQEDPSVIEEFSKKWDKILNARVTIIAKDGTVLGDSQEDHTQMDNHSNRPEVMKALNTGEGTSVRFSNSVRLDLMYTAVTIKDGNQVIGIARIALPLTQVEHNITMLRSTIVASIFLASLLSIAVATFIADRTTRPLRQLTGQAAKISSGETENVFLHFSNDEIGDISRAIRSMALQQHNQIETLSKERSLLAAVLDQMTDGVIIADPSGHVQMLNPAAERMLGVKQQDSINHSLAETLRLYQVVDIWKRCRDTSETQVVLIDQVPRHISLQCIATPLGQTLPGSTLLLFQDLTRIRQLETIRRDFIRNISRELHTPLASLKTLIETLQEGGLEDPPGAKILLQHIETEVEALSLMVSELLELSRIESGRVSLQLELVSPHAILDQAVEQLRLQVEQANLELHQEYPQSLPAILVDLPRIEQVVVNLLHNAIKFTPAPGEIWINAWKETQAGKTSSVVFSVKDTGVGIPAADLPRIFERFYKADRARSGKGTGLGLAIARHIVEAHGGQIWAESVEGKGSTFYFKIPISEGRKQD